MTPTQFDVKKDEVLPTVTPKESFDDILKDSNKGSQQSIANDVASTAPKGDVENSKSIPQTEPVVNTESGKN